MKIQCNVCEAAEANVLCCADEAALCYACDEKVHAANKLASKHQRVSLTNSASPMPKCDICQVYYSLITKYLRLCLFCVLTSLDRRDVIQTVCFINYLYLIIIYF